LSLVLKQSVYGLCPWYSSLVKTLAAGEFKQTCLRVLDEVRETGEVVVVTKRGVPVAQLVPIPQSYLEDWKGAMQGSGKILDDLVGPAIDPEEWEVLRP